MDYLFEKKSPLAFECKGYDPKTRRFEGIATAEVVDRDEEIVRVKGFEEDLDEFRKNPQLLYNHDALDKQPIGKVLEIGIDGTEMPFVGELRPAEDSEFQGHVNKSVEGGYLRFFSIGFRARKTEPGGVDRNGKKARRTITKASLFEVSLVTIPANTEARLKMLNFLQVITGEALAQDPAVKTIFGTPSDMDVLRRARTIIERLDTDQRKGLVLPEDLARESEALALDLWTRGERLASDRQLAAALDRLIKEAKP